MITTMNAPANVWNNLPSFIDPIAFSIGFFSVRWYSLMILLAFLVIYVLLRWRMKHDSFERLSLTRNMLETLFLYIAIGLFVGARLGYVLFYDLSNILENPLSIISPFNSESFVGFFGLSFHGGLLGVILGGMLFCKTHKTNMLDLADFLVPAIPLGYFFGRVGNFFNGELFGRTTDSTIGMVFSKDQTFLLRHPSQLYEAVGEGLLLFLLLWPLRNNKKLQGLFLPLYLVLYGIVRFVLEFFRMPDPQLGFVLFGLTMGQVLSIVMMSVGTGLFINAKFKVQNFK